MVEKGLSERLTGLVIKSRYIETADFDAETIWRQCSSIDSYFHSFLLLGSVPTLLY